ncbi:MAG TPA: tripartite tricarboxylate transporter substrate binding protein [Xanthobacteraceae bacterium]|jgi:tripartite-type tricarboxylate transporter receptor subunit TctC|nr:tripartite tricarboxylate transporter substrate binding protein [Xanthobacteraceae bacterium]
MTKSPTTAAPSRRGVIKAAGVLAAGIAAPALLRVRQAYAAFPDRPVKFVVANTPGGPSDIVGRIVTAALQQATGKTFIIENRPGAGSNLGMEYVAHSDPDGYTILLATTAFSVNYGLYNTLPFDPLKDFVAVSELGGSPNIYLVKPDLPAKTMKDFVALARSSPEKFNASVPPIGTTPQLQMALLKVREKLPNLEEVVFKGGGDAVEALIAGTVQICSGSVAPAQPHIKAGTLRGLAVCADARWADLPDVPTMIESGYPDFVFATDAMLLAPAKTPPEVVKWLETETLKVLNTQEMKDKMFQNGFLVRPKGAAACWARATKEMDTFKQIIDQAGIKKL